MNYGIGDTVVCIDSIESFPPRDVPTSGLSLGKEYKVRDMETCACGVTGVDVGVAGSWNEGAHCRTCDQSVRGCAHYAWRFIKLDGLTEENTTREEIAA